MEGSETRTGRLGRSEARRLRAIAAEFEDRRSAAGDVAGVISAIPAPIARALLGLGWRVDDAGAWISPRDAQRLAWRQALQAEFDRAG